MAKLGESVAVKTAFQMLDANSDGRFSREDTVLFAAHERDSLKQLNPVEAENVYKCLLKISDIYGLDKFARDGGLSYTMREYEIVRRIIAKRDLPDAVRVLQSAQFRAIDTNGDGFIQKSEWSNYLKICKIYTSDEKAMEAFDSLDKNKSGTISLPEFVESAVDFWCNTGKNLGAQNMYGTKHL